MYCVLGGSQVPGLCSLILWFKFNDRFTTALAITLAMVAQLLAAVGTCLLIRDGNNVRTLVETLHNADLLDLEQNRVHALVDTIKTCVIYLRASPLSVPC